MFQIGTKVRLKDMKYLGKATAPAGVVVALEGVIVLVRRTGIKTPKWYPAEAWEPEVQHDSVREMIRQYPWDFAVYLVYADQLEEQGNEKLGAAWRWMGMHSKRPIHYTQAGLSRRWVWLLDWKVHSATFYNEYDARLRDAAALPPALMLAVARTMNLPDRYAFQTEDEAVAALARALHTLKEIVK